MIRHTIGNACCIIVLTAMLLLGRAGFAAAPNLINYQGRLTNSAGQPVADGSYSVNFTLYNAPSGGVPQWGETQSVNTSNGLFAVRLGSVVLISADLFNDTSLYLAIKVGTDPEISPRTRLTAVPYALSSGDGWTHEGATVHLTTNADAVGIGTSTPTRPLHVSDPSNGLFVSRLESGNTGATVTEISNTSANSVWEASVAGSAGIPFWGVQPGDMYFYKQGTVFPNAVLTSGGSMGLGTAIPRARLEVATNDTIAGLFLSSNVSNSTNILRAECTGSGNQNVTAVYGRSVPVAGLGTGGFFEGGVIGVRGLVSQFTSADIYGAFAGSVGDGTGDKFGIQADALGFAGDKYGVYCRAEGPGNRRFGIFGLASSNTNDTGSYGGYFSSNGDAAIGVRAGAGGLNAIGLIATASGTGSRAAQFTGNVNVIGTLSKTAGSFTIDHPLDPENKYLQHSFVESPDMMNIYDGNVTTDASGNATIILPNWFEALNKDFRYQLTVIGQFAQAIVSSKISGNQFSIKTDKPNVEVSWQVTGIRHDPYAEQNRIQVELEKNERERGKYVSPESYGKGPEFGVGYREDLEKVAQGVIPSANDEKLKEIIEK